MLLLPKKTLQYFYSCR